MADWRDETPEPFRTLGSMAVGLGWGFGMAVLLTVATLLAGPTGRPPRGEFIGTFFLVGLPAGALAGALHPLTRRPAGAVLVGLALCGLSFLAAGALLGAFEPGVPGAVRTFAGLAALLFGFCWWRPLRDW